MLKSIVGSIQEQGLYFNTTNTDRIWASLHRRWNEAHLKVEYEHLCQGDEIKVYFNKYIKDCRVNIPDIYNHNSSCITCKADIAHIIIEFYFNFKGSILDVLHSRRESTSWMLLYQHFTARYFLPCREINGLLHKFTGSSEIRKATDDLTETIHAFAHFMLIYTSGFLLLSNLQGEWLLIIF